MGVGVGFPLHKPYPHQGVSKNRGTPKMDGENNGKSYFLMDDLGVYTPIFGSTSI